VLQLQAEFLFKFEVNSSALKLNFDSQSGPISGHWRFYAQIIKVMHLYIDLYNNTGTL
jgi:hypothetical protein